MLNTNLNISIFNKYPFELCLVFKLKNLNIISNGFEKHTKKKCKV